MAKQKKREPICLVSQGVEGKKSNYCYWTYKNKKTSSERLELKKFDPTLNLHCVFKEKK